MTIETRTLPENFYSIPGLLKQSKIFFIRDFLSKLANRQYVIISLLGSPLLAFLLAYFTKYTDRRMNTFSAKMKTCRAYLFMCVITSLFLGLIISAEEISQGQKNLEKGIIFESQLVQLPEFKGYDNVFNFSNSDDIVYSDRQLLYWKSRV